jgi:hypothetical protein
MSGRDLQGLTGVERCTNERNIVLDILTLQARPVANAAKSGNAREDRVGLSTLANELLHAAPQTYLSASISRQGIVPELFIRSSKRFLINPMSRMSKRTRCQRSHEQRNMSHLDAETTEISTVP